MKQCQIVNDAFLEHIREGKVDYIRGDTLGYTSEGVHVNVRGTVGMSKSKESGKPRLQSETFAPNSVKDETASHDEHSTLVNLTNGLSAYHPERKASSQIKGGSGIDKGQGGRFTKKGTDGKPEDIAADMKPEDIAADIVVIATGFAQPPVDFLPEDLYPEGFERPNLYLQVFSTEDWSVVLTNAAYKNAIGTMWVVAISIACMMIADLTIRNHLYVLARSTVVISILGSVSRELSCCFEPTC